MQDRIEFTAEIAETPIRIRAYTKELAPFFQEYLTEKEGLYSITLTGADMESERERFLAYYGCETDDPVQIEQSAALRKISDVLAGEQNTFLFHASSFILDGRAYLFTGKSGAGKTTHCRKWRELQSDIEMINDDKPFLKDTGEQILVYGGPWKGKEGIGSNLFAPLGGVICLEQARENRVVEMEDHRKWDILFGQFHRNEDAETMRRLLQTMRHLIESYPVVGLQCNMEEEAVTVIRHTINKWRKEACD